MSDTLGSRIRQRRCDLGLTQEQLADRVTTADDPVRQSDISRLESSKIRLPQYARLLRIADALDLPVGVLLARSGWAGAEDAFASTPTTPPPTAAQRDSPTRWDTDRVPDAAAGARHRDRNRATQRRIAQGDLRRRVEDNLARTERNRHRFEASRQRFLDRMAERSEADGARELRDADELPDQIDQGIDAERLHQDLP